MFVILQGNTRIAAHTVAKVDAKPQPHPAGVAIGTMKNGARAVVVQVANIAKVFGKWFSIGFAVWIDAPIFCGLQGIAFHAHDFCDGISIEWFVLVFGWHFPFLFATQSTRVQTTRNRMSQFTRPGVVWTPQHGPRGTIMISGCKLTGGK